MKINLMSDLHLEFQDMECPQTDADVIILAGDTHPGTKGLEWALGFNKPVIYVAGNHEYYGHVMEIVDEELTELNDAQPNLHVLSADNGSVMINGILFIGATLWTDFNIHGDADISMLRCRTEMNDYRMIRVKDNQTDSLFTPYKAKKLHEQHLAKIKTAIKVADGMPIVVVTHHAPSEQSLMKGLEWSDRKRDPAYGSNLEYVMLENPNIKLWVHGHVHISNDYVIGSTRVMSNPRGYTNKSKRPQNPDFNPGLVVEI